MESDLLERYLLGETNAIESLKVEDYIVRYPEADAHYKELQDNLEMYARSFSKPAPVDIKESLLSTIKVMNEPATRRSGSRTWFLVAASIAAVFFLSSSVFLWYQNKQLSLDNAKIVSQISGLKSDIVSTNAMLEDMRNNYAVLNNPETRKYVLNGNQRAKRLKTVAYINAEKKLSAINIVSLPDIPEEQVYQMWANVDGEMVSLGVLEKADKKLLSLPYKENMSSYNITIEPKGGVGPATLENMVASIDLQQ